MMSAGLRYSEDQPYKVNDITYRSTDLRKAALDNAAIIDPPGKYFLYNDYNPPLICIVPERAPGMPVIKYLHKKRWDPLGMEFGGSWSTDRTNNGFEKMLIGVNARSIDFAKLGRLFLMNGMAGGKQIFSEHWVQEATQPEEKPASYYNNEQFMI